MRTREIGARPAGGGLARRRNFVAASFTGAILFCGPAWAQSNYTVVTGTFTVSADTNLGPPASTLTLDAGTALAFVGSFTFNHTIILGGDPVFDVPPGQTITISTPITDGATPSDVVKTDGGTLILAAQNTYTGATTIQGGTLAMGNGGSIATSSGVSLTAAGTIFDITSAGAQTIGDLSGVAGSSVTLGANTLFLGTANSTTFAGVISGTGALLKEGSGTLTFTGANTYSGLTSVTAGTLAIGAGGSITLSSGVNLESAGTTFDISAAGNQTIGDLFGVAGSSVILGANTLTLGTTNTSSFAGVVSGTGGLTKQGAGTLFLSGANTYTGATTITAGTLFLAVGGSLAASSGLNLTSSTATFDFATAGNQTIKDLTGVTGSEVLLGANTLTVGTANSTNFAGAISGTGGLTKQGSGTLTLSGDNTYTGATTINAGTLAIGAGGSILFSSGINTAAAGAILDISAAGNQTIGDLTGVAGSFVNLGANRLTLGFTDSTTYAGVIEGTGRLTKQGAGTLTLTGANTYSGGTTITAGTLVGNTTSLQGSITNDATLAFNQASAGTYAGSLVGTGTLIVEGMGGVTFTGNSAAYTGNTLVTGGGLTIGPVANAGGSLGGSVTVENGAFVAGHGAIGGSLANPSGVVASSGAAAPLTVGGAYTQSAGGTLLVGLSPAAATRLSVTGGANLAGTLDIQSAPGQNYIPFSKFTILNTGSSVNGTFGQLIGVLPVLPVTVTYLPRSVTLTLGGFIGVTANETAVASALNTAFPTASGDFATVLDNAVFLAPGQMAASLSSLGGQIYGNLPEVSLQDRRLFLGAMDERLRLLGIESPAAATMGSLGGSGPTGWGRGPNAMQLAAIVNAASDPIGELIDRRMVSTADSPDLIDDPVGLAVPPPTGGGSYPPMAPPASALVGDAINDPVGLAATQTTAQAASPLPKSGNVWARGFGQFGSLKSNNGALGSNYSTGGGAIGADLISSREQLFGVAVGAGQSSVALDTNPENGTISFFELGLYGAQTLGGGFVLDGAGIFAHDSYSVTRGIVLPGTSRVASSSHGGNDAVVDVGVSRPYIAGGWQVTPRLGVSYFHIGQSGFSESGADSLDLAVSPNGLNALFSSIGVAISEPMRLGETGILPEARVAWLHNFLGGQSRYNATFAGAGAPTFGQVGPAPGRDTIDLGAGVSVAIAQQWVPAQVTGFLQYDALVAVHEFANTVAGGLRAKW